MSFSKNLNQIYEKINMINELSNMISYFEVSNNTIVCIGELIREKNEQLQRIVDDLFEKL